MQIISKKFIQCSNFPFDPTQSKTMLNLLDKLETIDEWLEIKEKQITP